LYNLNSVYLEKLCKQSIWKLQINSEVNSLVQLALIVSGEWCSSSLTLSSIYCTIKNELQVVSNRRHSTICNNDYESLKNPNSGQKMAIFNLILHYSVFVFHINFWEVFIWEHSLNCRTKICYLLKLLNLSISSMESHK